MKSRGFGFTLIEILVALLLLGGLVAIATPVYRSYVDRARMSEAVSVVQTVLLSASELCGMNALGSATDAQLGVSTPSAFATAKVVASISASDVSADGLYVTVTLKKFGDVSAGDTLVIKGSCQNRSMNWTVDTSSTAPAQLLPKQI